MSGPAGEIYRLKATVATPACASVSPQAAIIITAFRDYGIILADNGQSGGLIGTPDQIIEQFDITREQINAVLEFAARSLEATPASIAASNGSVNAHSL